MKKITIIITVIIIIAILIGGYFLYQKFQASRVQTSPVDQTAGWSTYTDNVNGIQFKYPATFSDAVWRAQTWPPSIYVVNGKKTADEACANNSAGVPFTFVAIEKIGVNNFSLLKSSDAGAGQLYTDYCYILNTNNKNYVINFVIHSTNGCGNGNCGPWCGTPNEQACKNFDMQKEVVQPIEQIVSTFKFTK